jgi:hypothetical protein
MAAKYGQNVLLMPNRTKCILLVPVIKNRALLVPVYLSVSFGVIGASVCLCTAPKSCFMV